MAGSIAKAYVQVLPSAQGLRGNLSNVFSSEMPSAGQSAGGIFGSNLIGKIKGLIVTAGIGKAFTDAIMSGSDSEQLKGGVLKIFDEMDTSTIMADAANAYKDVNMSANQYLATINDVGAAFSATMGDEKGYSVARTGLKAISDYATGTGKNVDILSEKFTMITRSTSSYQSIADQFSGILPATSAGFLEQAQAAGFLSDQYRSLTEVPIDEYQQAVAEMLAKGTADLGLAGNTAAETATTFAGSLAAMKSAYSNFLGALATGEDIGTALEVLGETVFTFISGNLMPMVGTILSGLPQVLSSAFSMAIRGLNMVADNADTIVQQGVELVSAIGSSIVAAIPYLLKAALRLVGALGNAIVSTDWGQVAQDTIGEMRSSLDLAAGEILGTDGNIVQSVLDAISAGLPSILEGGVGIVSKLANGLLAGLPNLISSAGELLVSLFDLLWGAAPQVWSSGFELIQNLASGLLANLPAIAKSAISLIGDLLSTFASHLPQMIEQGYTMMGEWAAGLISAIPDVISAAIDIAGCILDTLGETDWLALGTDIINGIVKGIINAAGAIWDAMVNVANQALSAAKEALGIHSPSWRFRQEVGRQIPPGVALGVDDSTGLVETAMKDLSDITADSFTSNLRIDTGSALRGVGNSGIGGKVVSVVQHIHSEAKTAADLMQEAQYYQERAVLLGV